MTVKAVSLGIVLAVVLCAANVYLGLMAGMTVSASIPAAVISMGIMRGVFKRGTILENNIVQTIASAGESLAAGVIFTVPALVLAGLWADFKFWPTFFIGLLGGLLGLLFMIPLRRTLIIEEKELTYPEGVACAEILEAGQKDGGGIKYIFSALALGMAFALLQEFKLLAAKLAGAFKLKGAVFAFGVKMSVALLSVGYIVGFNVAALVFIGGFIAWFIAIPIYTVLHPELVPAGADLAQVAGDIWDSHIRYMGAGAMVVGGLWSIFKMRRSLLAGLKEALRMFAAGAGDAATERTERDLPMTVIMPALAVVIAGIFFLYWNFTGAAFTALICAVAMVVTGFLFVAVSSYIVGLVGSSNNPVSGMTIFTLLFAAALLLAFSVTGQAGMMAALVVAGVVCCAACAAGDMSQDLKTGYLVGATPRQQQIGQAIGVVVAAFVTTPVLIMLHKAYVIGSKDKLPAPQATFFKNITEAIFKHEVPWAMLIAGAVVAGLLIVLDEIARARKWPFRLYVMPVAVGIYLPFSMAVPILLGGLCKLIFGKGTSSGADRGILAASGLIAGEALIGILIAGVMLLRMSMGERATAEVLGVAAFAAVAALLAWLARPTAKPDEGAAKAE